MVLAAEDDRRAQDCGLRESLADFGFAVAFAAADAAATVVNVKFTGVPGAIKA